MSLSSPIHFAHVLSRHLLALALLTPEVYHLPLDEDTLTYSQSPPLQWLDCIVIIAFPDAQPVLSILVDFPSHDDVLLSKPEVDLRSRHIPTPRNLWSSHLYKREYQAT